MRAVGSFQMLDWKSWEGFRDSLPPWFEEAVRRMSGVFEFSPRREECDEEALLEVGAPGLSLHAHEGDWVVLFEDGSIGVMDDCAHKAVFGEEAS